MTAASRTRVAATPAAVPSLVDGVARRLVCARFSALRRGAVTVIDDRGASRFGAPESGEVPSGTLRVVDPRVWRRAALGGAIGLAESYADGDWTSDDLVAFMRVFAREAAVSDGVERLGARLAKPLRRLRHAIRRDTRAGSRRNIHEHYDLGNEFFRLWLDPTMTYSCAVFPRPDASLEDAQIEKIDRICRKLALKPGESLLEIGTGWGALALHAARQYGVNVTTTTISDEQYRHATDLVARQGLGDRIRVLSCDYRDLAGTFDKLVSVEMIEAVGAAYFDAYFAACSRLLAPHGRMLIQSITIAENRYDHALHSVDFIQKHIFPGSCIPSLAAIMRSVAKATDLGLAHLEDITAHYVRTLSEWRRRFLAARARVTDLGFSERFVRIWDWYLAYCEAGFAERRIGDVQLLFVKPGFREDPIGIGAAAEGVTP